MAKTHALVDSLFRDKYRDILAALTREFGAANLDRIEDAVQESMIKALNSWSVGEVPANPGGWLFVTARRGLIDKLRQHRRRGGNAHEAASEQPAETLPMVLDPLDDDVLKMLFICCHPALGWKAQLALMLKNVCALGNFEIATVLLGKEDSVKRTLTRAKARIRQLDLTFEIPHDASVDDRLDGVLRCVYMMFNEGYLSHDGERHIRQGLCDEAIKLARILVRSSGISDPGKVCALAALLVLQGSRLRARTSARGEIVRLADQDRALWDRQLIAEGMGYLELAMTSPQRSTYHLQAAIAACHATAPSHEATDWRAILRYYDHLLELQPSVVVALNRTVAIAMTEGYAPALKAVDELAAAPELADYYLLPALQADYLMQLGEARRARAYYASALKRVGEPASRRFLEERLAACAFDY